MTFIHPLLLTGLVLAGIPVLIHLIMQQKPKHLLFPAFRFLQQRHRTNQRHLRLRHLLLLLLRVALIAGICLALARPRLFSERLNLSSDSPVVVALLFDTSYSMEYKLADRTRLDEAKRRALELLDELPENSRVAVLDSADLGGEWTTALTQARDQIGRLQLRHANAPVTRQLAQAYQLFERLGQEPNENGETPPRFLYVFSDRTPASWDTGDVRSLAPAPEAGIHAVFVDVGVDKPADVAIVNLEVAHPVITPDDRVEVTVTVQATGLDCDTFLALSIDGETLAEQRPIKLRAGQQRAEPFGRRATDLAPGMHRIEVRLGTPDSLPFDDARFATFEVRGARKVLTLADRPQDGRIWRLALNTARTFHCDDVLPVAKAGSLDPQKLLADYKAICLIDVAEPGPTLWALLEAYAQKGGNLVIVPGGPELKLDAYQRDPAAVRLLPARLENLVTNLDQGGAPWDESQATHLLLAPFREWRRSASVDFYQPELLPRAQHYWEVTVDPAVKEAGVIVAYADDKQRPALLERAVGQGHVLLATTGFDGRRVNDRPWWNNYLESSFYPVLVNKLVGYLAGDALEPTFNYLAGQPVPVPLPPVPRFPFYMLEGPGLVGPETSVARAEDQNQVEIRQAVQPGNYTLRDTAGQAVAGFSINARPEECQLTRDPELVKKIEAVLGPDTVLAVGHTATLHDALQRHWRQPVELFPWLMIALLLVLAVENLLANKFYRRSAAP